jgi:hypothetical protein
MPESQSPTELKIEDPAMAALARVVDCYTKAVCERMLCAERDLRPETAMLVNHFADQRLSYLRLRSMVIALLAHIEKPTEPALATLLTAIRDEVGL